MRAALRFVFRRLVAIYFRDVEIAGDVPGPDTGGRIFAANHVNALVDPILVLTQAPCAISPVPLALIGMVLYWLPYQVPRAVARRLRRARIVWRDSRRWPSNVPS